MQLVGDIFNRWNGLPFSCFCQLALQRLFKALKKRALALFAG